MEPICQMYNRVEYCGYDGHLQCFVTKAVGAHIDELDEKLQRTRLDELAYCKVSVRYNT